MRWPYGPIGDNTGTRGFRNLLNKIFGDIGADANEQKARVDNLIRNTPQPSEVVDLRVDEAGVEHQTANDRIVSDSQKVAAQLAEKVPQINYDADRAYFEARLNALTSAFGDSYETLSALQSAHPTNDGKNHFVSSDNSWYFWIDGVGWTSGGSMNNISLAANSVTTREKTHLGEYGEILAAHPYNFDSINKTIAFDGAQIISRNNRYTDISGQTYDASSAFDKGGHFYFNVVNRQFKTISADNGDSNNISKVTEDDLYLGSMWNPNNSDGFMINMNGDKNFTIDGKRYYGDRMFEEKINIVLNFDSAHSYFSIDDDQLSEDKNIVSGKIISAISGHTFYPCYFGVDRIKLQLQNTDTWIVLANNTLSGEFLILGLGNNNKTGRVWKVASNGSYTNVTNTYLSFLGDHIPDLSIGDVIEIATSGTAFYLYVNDQIKMRYDLSLTNTGINNWNLGVCTTPSTPAAIKLITKDDPVYKNVLSDNSRWIGSRQYGAELNILGDSFTSLANQVKSKYYYYIQQICGFKTINNYGVGGTTISQKATPDGTSFLERCADMSTTAETTIVFGGTNDYGQHHELGTINSTDNTTFYGATKALCAGLIDMYPGKLIVFVTPLMRVSPPDGMDAGSAVNNLGYNLEQYVAAMKEVCAMYAIPCFDLYHSSNIYPKNAKVNSMLLIDGLHPTEFGHSIIGRKIGKFIEAQM